MFRRMDTKMNKYFGRFKQYYLEHSVPFVFILCGIAGMLVDIDHIPKCYTCSWADIGVSTAVRFTLCFSSINP